jgi:hypothetical protein
MLCPPHLPWLDLPDDVWGTNYEVSHCATSSILPSPHPSLVQIFFSEPCSQTPTVYAVPLAWETKFHTQLPHTIEQIIVRCQWRPVNICSSWFTYIGWVQALVQYLRRVWGDYLGQEM